jgi:tetratricopeptide (TPR) repeat protein
LITFFPPFEWVWGAGRPSTLKARMAEAVPLYRGALADCERVRGADHPSTLRARNNLAMAYQAAGRTADAIPLLEQALAGYERVLGAGHPDTLTTRSNLAMAREDLTARTGKQKRSRRVRSKV